MAKYFYYNDKGEKKGAFSGREIKAMAKGGLINPNTMIETEDGKRYTANGIGGVEFGNSQKNEPSKPPKISGDFPIITNSSSIVPISVPLQSEIQKTAENGQNFRGILTHRQIIIGVAGIIVGLCILNSIIFVTKARQEQAQIRQAEIEKDRLQKEQQWKLKLRIEYLDDFGNRHTDKIMQKSRQDHCSIPDGCIRHRIGNDRFDYFLTLRTIITADRMFGDFGRDVFGNVFDDACTFLFAFVEFGSAVGTTFRTMSLHFRTWSSIFPERMLNFFRPIKNFIQNSTR